MSPRSLAVLVTIALVMTLAATPPAQASFIGVDIGTTLAGSDSGSLPGPISMIGDGADIWGTADAFRYYYDTWSGNFLATARIVSQVQTDAWAKAGIMVRANTTPGSMNVHIDGTPQQVAFQWRDSAGADSGWANSFIPGSYSTQTAPIWVRLKRTGTTFTAYYAPDVGGVPGTWSTPRAEDIHTSANMPTNILLGLNVTSHNGGALSTVVFDNVSFEPLANPYGRLAALDHANVGGAAYAQVPGGGPVVGPVHWRLDRQIASDVVGKVMSQWYFGIQGQNHAPGGTNGFLTMASDPTLTHVDWAISKIDWSNVGGGAAYPPETGYSGDMGNFTVRHFGQILINPDPANPNAPRSVRFQDHNDDWAILTVDGALTGINDGNWTSWDGTQNPGGIATTTLSLTPGWHDFEFFMSEGGGGDNARLLWDYDPVSNTFGGSFVTVASEYFRVRALVDQLLAEGDYNVGGPAQDGFFFNIGSMPGEDILMKLTVSYQGSSVAYYGEFFGVPEPATCLLLGGGLLALLRRRRRAK